MRFLPESDRDERKARARRVHEDEPGGIAIERCLPFTGVHVRPDEVELGGGSIECAMPYQDDQERIFGRQARLELGQRFRHAVSIRNRRTFLGENGDALCREPHPFLERGLQRRNQRLLSVCELVAARHSGDDERIPLLRQNAGRQHGECQQRQRGQEDAAAHY